MKKFPLIIVSALILSFLGLNTVYAEVTEKDYKEVVKITKKLRKLSDKNDIEGIAKYYSDDYKSFDGYDKKQILEIFETAKKLYPDSKTKETIKKVEEKDGLIKVYLDETSKMDITIKGEEALYAENQKIKGIMTSGADYSMTYKKEGEKWMVLADEIYEEYTDIRYGEAIEADFKMEAPDTIKPGEEITVKITIEAPEERIVVGSIGHDKIIYPPEKYWDPYRSIDETGILERVMVTNDEGINEYANATFAFVKTGGFKMNKNSPQKAVISGMGFYVKRMNVQNGGQKNEG